MGRRKAKPIRCRRAPRRLHMRSYHAAFSVRSRTVGDEERRRCDTCDYGSRVERRRFRNATIIGVLRVIWSQDTSQVGRNDRIRSQRESGKALSIEPRPTGTRDMCMLLHICSCSNHKETIRKGGGQPRPREEAGAEPTSESCFSWRFDSDRVHYDILIKRKLSRTLEDLPLEERTH